MSPLQFRPRIRMPWQAIAGFAAVLYVIRSGMRGWDFRPAILDIMVFGALALILLVRPLVDHLLRDDSDTGPPAEDEDGEAPTS